MKSNIKIVIGVIALVVVIALAYFLFFNKEENVYASININNIVEIEITKQHKVLSIKGNDTSFEGITSTSLEEVINQTVDILNSNNSLTTINVTTNVNDAELDFVLNQYLTNKVTLISKDISINIK